MQRSSICLSRISSSPRILDFRRIKDFPPEVTAQILRGSQVHFAPAEKGGQFRLQAGPRPATQACDPVRTRPIRQCRFPARNRPATPTRKWPASECPSHGRTRPIRSSGSGVANSCPNCPIGVDLKPGRFPFPNEPHLPTVTCIRRDVDNPIAVRGNFHILLRDYADPHPPVYQ